LNTSPVKTADTLRADILAFEHLLSHLPSVVFGDADCLPLTHAFADGLYIRELCIPQGFLWVGKLHRYAHGHFLLRGEILVVTEFTGVVHQKAPQYMVTPAGTKRVGLALSDTTIVTVHATTETDLTKIEADIIAPGYAALVRDIRRHVVQEAPL